MASPACTTLPSYMSGTNSAGSTTNGASQDCRTAVSVRFAGTITNGATAPTVPAACNFQISEDNSTWYTYYTATASTTNSQPTPFSFFMLYPGAYVRLQVTANTVQSVTYVAVGSIIIGIA